MEEKRFCDYYENLQISPSASAETVETVFRLLAKKYHTDNHATGDIEKFNLITDAHKVLSNPATRAAYDANYKESKNQQWRSISKAYSGEGFESDRHIRRMLLSILYTKRREDPSNAGVGIMQIENMMEWPAETLDFHVWYLKEKGLVERTVTGGFEITAEGVDQIEADGLALREDRLLPEKTDAKDGSKEIYMLEERNIGKRRAS